MREYLGVAEEQGIPDEEMGAVLSIVMAVSGCRVRAQLDDARRRRRARAASPEAPGARPPRSESPGG